MKLLFKFSHMAALHVAVEKLNIDMVKLLLTCQDLKINNLIIFIIYFQIKFIKCII